MDKYEEFREFCKKIRKTEKSPRSLQAYWTLDFMDQFDEMTSNNGPTSSDIAVEAEGTV